MADDLSFVAEKVRDILEGVSDSHIIIATHAAIRYLSNVNTAAHFGYEEYRPDIDAIVEELDPVSREKALEIIEAVETGVGVDLRKIPMEQVKQAIVLIGNLGLELTRKESTLSLQRIQELMQKVALPEPYRVTK